MMNLWRHFSKELTHAGPSAIKIDSVMRDRIDAVRVTCVLMMMYVHVPDGQATAESSFGNLPNIRLDHWLESIFIEGPGRASAALLSVVSGYLIVYTLRRSDNVVLSLYRRRFISIVLPMVFWGLLTCLVYWILDQGHDTFIDSANTWHGKLNLVLFIYEAPYGPTLHLAFLRDLFVCVLLSPLLFVALRRFPKTVIGILGLIYLVEHSGQLYIILRPLVVLGFSIGMLLAQRNAQLDALDKYWAWFLSLMGVFAVLIIWANAGLLAPVESHLAEQGISLKESILYPLCRLFGSLTIWCILPVWNGVRLKRFTTAFSPYLFAAFCSHFLVLTLLFNGLWMPLVGDRDSYYYLLWFVSAPLIAMITSMIMVNMAARTFPLLATLITGGRMSVNSLIRGSRGDLVPLN